MTSWHCWELKIFKWSYLCRKNVWFVNKMIGFQGLNFCRWKKKDSKNQFIFPSEKNLKKTIFVFNPFHIGVLCTKTLEGFRQALEWSKWKNISIFPNIIFQKILNLAEKVAKNQFWDFSPFSITLAFRSFFHD